MVFTHPKVIPGVNLHKPNVGDSLLWLPRVQSVRICSLHASKGFNIFVNHDVLSHKVFHEGINAKRPAVPIQGRVKMKYLLSKAFMETMDKLYAVLEQK